MTKILKWHVTYKCSDSVCFLDDIFNKNENNNGFCFVKLDDTDNLLLICAKHLIYFSDKPLYTLYLEPLNGGIQIFNKLKDNMFIQGIFNITDDFFQQTDVFKAVLYTVLFVLKSNISIHLKYMNFMIILIIRIIR